MSDRFYRTLNVGLAVYIAVILILTLALGLDGLVAIPAAVIAGIWAQIRYSKREPRRG